MASNREASARWRTKLQLDPVRYEAWKARKRLRYRLSREDPEQIAKARAANRAAYQRDPDRYRAKNRASYARHREERMAYGRQRQNDPVFRLRQRLRRYGLTVEQFRRLQERDPACAICGSMGNAKGLGIDHDHSTGRVRGLLCGYCNALLHKLEGQPGWIEAAQRYLQRFEIPFYLPGSVPHI